MLAPLDVLLIRHAEPVAPYTTDHADDDRPLTDAGRAAAADLAAELDGYEVTALYSSPYARAAETIAVMAKRRGLPVQTLDDLRERRLSGELLGDSWPEHLKAAWVDASAVLPGGESGRDAQRRAIGILDLLRARHPDGGRVVIGSHGNLISLMLHAFDPAVDFAFHMAMPMPALYQLTHDGLRWRIMGGHGFAPVEEGDA
ncbi:MAG: histidine phosphatase family protein [Candidatus Limnocylindria bacterium]